MKYFYTLLILITFATIAFAWCTSDPADCGGWIVEHSEIYPAEYYGAVLMEQSIERSERLR